MEALCRPSHTLPADLPCLTWQVGEAASRFVPCPTQFPNAPVGGRGSSQNSPNLLTCSNRSPDPSWYRHRAGVSQVEVSAEFRAPATIRTGSPSNCGQRRGIHAFLAGNCGTACLFMAFLANTQRSWRGRHESRPPLWERHEFKSVCASGGQSPSYGTIPCSTGGGTVRLSEGDFRVVYRFGRNGSRSVGDVQVLTDICRVRRVRLTLPFYISRPPDVRTCPLQHVVSGCRHASSMAGCPKTVSVADRPGPIASSAPPAHVYAAYDVTRAAVPAKAYSSECKYVVPYGWQSSLRMCTSRPTCSHVLGTGCREACASC